MSIRTLIEINHDRTWDMDRDPDFLRALTGYLAGGSTRCKEALEQYGIKVISQRHHSSEFRIDPATDGFACLRTPTTPPDGEGRHD